MNRRMPNGTSGGVGGRGRRRPLLPDQTAGMGDRSVNSVVGQDFLCTRARFHRAFDLFEERL